MASITLVTENRETSGARATRQARRVTCCKRPIKKPCGSPPESPRILILALPESPSSANEPMKTLIEFSNVNPRIRESISAKVSDYLESNLETHLSYAEVHLYCEHFLVENTSSSSTKNDDAGVVFRLRGATVVHPEIRTGGALRQLVVWLAHAILEKQHVKALKPCVSSFYLLASNSDRITPKQFGELFSKQEDLVRDVVYGGAYTVLLRSLIYTLPHAKSVQSVDHLLEAVPHLARETARVVREMVRDWVRNNVRYEDPEDATRYIDAREVSSKLDIVKLHELAFKHLFEEPRDELSKRLSDLHYMWSGRMT